MHVSWLAQDLLEGAVCMLEGAVCIIHLRSSALARRTMQSCVLKHVWLYSKQRYQIQPTARGKRK